MNPAPACSSLCDLGKSLTLSGPRVYQGNSNRTDLEVVVLGLKSDNSWQPVRPEDEERQAAEGSGESPQAEGTADAGDGQEGGHCKRSVRRKVVLVVSAPGSMTCSSPGLGGSS